MNDYAKPYWRVIEHVNHIKFSDGGVIVIEDDPDIIHFDNSSDLLLFTSLNDLDNATLHIYGQSTEVDAPPDIIDVIDEDDDISDDEDALPHDLAYSDNEDLINVDDDGVDKMSADVARSHDDDGGGEDRPLHAMQRQTKVQFGRQGSGGRAQPLRSTRRSLTPSSWHTLLTGNSFGMRTDEVMRRLEATGTYTDDEINRLARGDKQRGHIPGVGRVLPARATASPSTPAHESTLNSLHKKVDFMMSLFKSDSKYSDTFSQLESGGASGSGGCRDDEEGADDQDDEDEDGDGDT
nr:F-box domain, leucine-rich repeat domain, L domain-like protein [Tanacetum cinerariifolium]